MSGILLFSTVTITLALVSYSIGVWSERISRFLQAWHVFMFWTGFLFDVSGTVAMHFISEDAFNLRDLHTLTGQIALWLMLAHALWATLVMRSNNTKLRKKFHLYSIIVWMVWLVPYMGGMIMGMKHG